MDILRYYSFNYRSGFSKIRPPPTFIAFMRVALKSGLSTFFSMHVHQRMKRYYIQKFHKHCSNITLSDGNLQKIAYFRTEMSHYDL